jgi:hypothetical protein
MTLFARRRRNAPASRLVGALLAVVSLLSACGGSTPAGGDPGDKRLKELTSDRVFAALPDGATEIDTKEQPAQYRKPGFSGGGWDGPSVVVTFKTSSPPAEVYRFYAQNAESAGWKPTAAGALGLTDRWAKTYSDGAPATLTLALLTSESSQRVYRLSGGVAPATS